MKFATKHIRYYPPHLRHVATLPWEIENQIFCGYSARMEENAKKLHIKCTDCNSSTRATVYFECIYVFKSLNYLFSSLNTMLIVDKHCCDVCCDEFPVSQIDRKQVNK